MLLQQTVRVNARSQPFKPAVACRPSVPTIVTSKQQRSVVVRANPLENVINTITVALKNSPLNEGELCSIWDLVVMRTAQCTRLHLVHVQWKVNGFVAAHTAGTALVHALICNSPLHLAVRHKISAP